MLTRQNGWMWAVLGLHLFWILPPAHGQDRAVQRSPRAQKLSLAYCLRLALSQHPRVRMSELALESKHDLLLSAKGVWDPTLELGALRSRVEEPQPTSLVGDVQDSAYYSVGLTQKTPLGTEATLGYTQTRLASNSSFQTLNPSQANQATLSLLQPLGQNFSGLQDRGAILLRQADWELARFQHQQEIESLIQDVDKAYWQWTQAREVVELREQLLAFSQAFQKAEAGRAKMLVRPPASLLQIQADVLLREQELEQAQQAAREAERTLRTLTQLSETDRSVGSVPSDRMESRLSVKDLEENLVQAFQHRKDYLYQRRKMERDRIEVKLEKNKKWPDVNLLASLKANGLGGVSSEAQKSLAQDDFYSWDLGLSLRVPLGNRRARGLAQDAEARAERELLATKKLEQDIQEGVRRSHAEFLSLERRNALSESRLQFQKRRLSQGERDYRDGRIQIKDLLDIQTDVAAASLDHLDVLLARRLSWTNLLAAEGLLYETFALPVGEQR